MVTTAYFETTTTDAEATHRAHPVGDHSNDGSNGLPLKKSSIVDRIIQLEKDTAALKEENVLLKADYMLLKEENVLLKADNVLLKEENVLLKAAFAKLKTDNVLLKEETAQLKRNVDNLKSRVADLGLAFDSTKTHLSCEKKLAITRANRLKSAEQLHLALSSHLDNPKDPEGPKRVRDAQVDHSTDLTDDERAYTNYKASKRQYERHGSISAADEQQ